MKKILFLWLGFVGAVTVLSGCSQQQKPKTDWDKYDLKGKVQQLQVHYCLAYEDSTGAIVPYDMTSADYINFSEEGKIERIVTYDYAQEQPQTYIYDYTYHPKGLTILATLDDAFHYREEISYTDWGEISTDKMYDADSANYWCEFFEYDDDQRLATHFLHGRDGLMYFYDDYRYNEQGLPVYNENRDADGSVECCVYSSYDADGRLVRQQFQYADSTYDFEYIHTYNEQGLPEKFTRHSSNSTVEVRYLYEFDEQGNYTSKTILSGDFARIEERKIYYY